MGTTPKEYDLEYWRERFAELLEKLDSEIVLSQALGMHDDYFNTSRGYWAANNVKTGKGGLAATRRVVDALENYLKDKSIMKKVSRRHGLKV